MSYHGKRVYGGRERSNGGGASNALVRVLFFPVLFVYLELVLHVYMGTELKYLPIWLLYGLAAGCV